MANGKPMFNLKVSETAAIRMAKNESLLDDCGGPLAMNPKYLKPKDEEEEINYEWNLDEEEKEDKEN